MLSRARRMQTDREFSSVAQLPQFPGPSVITRHNASEDPDTGTAETVDLMQQAAIEDSTSPQVWAATRQATHGSRSKRQSVDGIYNWIASRVCFRSDDPVLKNLLGLDNELDLLIRPARLLTMSRPAEDCDGFTMLACSMMLCAGVPCEIVTIKADPEDPGRFSHVYCQAILQDGPLCMDCSQAAQHGYPIGWEAPDYFDRKSWGILQPQQQEKGMHGYNGLGDGLPSGTDYALCLSDPNCSVGGVVGMSPTAPYIPASQTPQPTFGGIPSGSPSGFDLNKFIQQITAGGLQIAKMQATPVGYVQTPTMTANFGSGSAIPGLNFGAGIGSMSPLLLLGGGALLLFALARK
jgi:hypothetical protein